MTRPDTWRRRTPGILAGLLLCAVAGLVLAAERKSDTSLLDQLEALEQEAETLNRDIAQIGARREELNRELDASAAQAKALLSQVEEGRGRLAARLRTAYKLSEGASWEYLLASRDFGDYVLRRHYLARLWKKDRDLLRAYHRHLAEMDENAADVTRRREELDALRAELETRKKALDARMAETRRFVEQVRRDADLKARAEREVQTARNALSKDIKELKSGVTGGSFSQLKGKMRCPVSGVITATFGESGQGEDKRFHGGLDIRASEGVPVHSPAAGRIVFSGRFRGFGNLVILDHGEGYHSLYGHLRELMQAEGASLSAGERVGHVGATGSLKGPMLYFELRHKGKPINPEEWVRCR